MDIRKCHSLIPSRFKKINFFLSSRRRGYEATSITSSLPPSLPTTLPASSHGSGALLAIWQVVATRLSHENTVDSTPPGVGPVSERSHDRGPGAAGEKWNIVTECVFVFVCVCVCVWPHVEAGV